MAAGAVGGWLALHGGPRTSGTGVGTYRDASFGWTIRYPDRLRSEPFTSPDARTGVPVDGIRLTNFEPDLSARSTPRPIGVSWIQADLSRACAEKVLRSVASRLRAARRRRVPGGIRPKQLHILVPQARDDLGPIGATDALPP